MLSTELSKSARRIDRVQAVRTSRGASSWTFRERAEPRSSRLDACGRCRMSLRHPPRPMFRHQVSWRGEGYSTSLTLRVNRSSDFFQNSRDRSEVARRPQGFDAIGRFEKAGEPLAPAVFVVRIREARAIVARDFSGSTLYPGFFREFSPKPSRRSVGIRHKSHRNPSFGQAVFGWIWGAGRPMKVLRTHSFLRTRARNALRDQWSRSSRCGEVHGRSSSSCPRP